MASQKLKVTQTRSHIGHKPEQLKTLTALGLGRIGKTKVLTENASVLGMLKAVSHLVDIEKAK
ncbi:50S ribosomal protein L30 [bacterium]|nr:50S ribosomal protein L30 [bacterium]